MPANPTLNRKHTKLLAGYTTSLAAYNAASTVEIREYYLRRFMLWAQAEGHGNVLKLGLQDLMTWLAKHIGPSISTKRSGRAALTTFYRWATDVEHTKANPSSKLPPIRSSRGVPNPCPNDVIAQGLSRCTRPKDVLMILFGELQGMRAGEIAQSHSDDVLLATRQLRILGKGNKERIVPLHPLLLEILPTFPAGYFFPSALNATGHMLNRSIGRRIRHLLGYQRGRHAHSLRHKFAVGALELNHDILALRDLLGHANVATTQIYTKASTTRLEAMVTALPEPPGRRARITQLRYELTD